MTHPHAHKFSFGAIFCVILAALLFSASLTACKGAQRREGESQYSFDARAKYEAGLKSLDGGYYADAIKLFNEVKTQYPFSQYATLSELKIADTYYAQGDYTQSIDRYRLFANLHPNHEKVPYAFYMVGMAYFKQAPSDFFIFPPAHENDQTPTRNAVVAFRQYMSRFPEDENIKDAREKTDKCLNMLAGTEFYVAEFYAKRNKPQAAIARLETLKEKYPEAEEYGEAMLLLAEMYVEVEEKKKAETILNSIIARSNDEKSAKKAGKMLDKLKREGG